MIFMVPSINSNNLYPVIIRNKEEFEKGKRGSYYYLSGRWKIGTYGNKNGYSKKRPVTKQERKEILKSFVLWRMSQ